MCSHGYTGFKRWVLGSVAHNVAWHSTIPVLIIHEDDQKLTSLSPEVGHPIRALVALDGTPFTEAVLMPTIQLVMACSAPARGELHLANMVKLPPLEEEIAYERFGIDRHLRQAALYRAEHHLEGIKERLYCEMGSEPTVDITWSVEECTDVADTLLRRAKGEGDVTHIPSDLIALTTHGRSGLDRWVRGSVAERILNSATMPLLVVHPQKPSFSFASHTSESEQAMSSD
jgi:nucleotide-binding universal stress UspA family protein